MDAIAPPSHKSKVLGFLTPYNISIMLTGVFWGVLGLVGPFLLDDFWNGILPISKGTLIGQNTDMRLFRNLFSMIIAQSQSHIFAGFVHGIVMMVIAHFVMKISRQKSVLCVVLFSALLLCMSRAIFYQTFMWTAGFAAYIIPFMFLLPVIWRISIDREPRLFEYFLYPLLALISVFFLENLSTTVTILLLTSAVYGITKQKQSLFRCIVTIFQSLGLLFMLSGSKMTQSTENGATPSYNLDILHAQKYDLIAAVINWANKIFSELVVDNWILITLVLMLLICMTFLFDCQTITKLNNLNYQRFSTICLIFGVISVLQLVITPLSVASRVFMPFIMSLIILAIFLFGQIQQYLPSLKIILLPLLLTVGIIMQGMMYAAILPWQMVLESNIRSVHDGITNTIVLPPPLMVEYWHEPIVKDLLTQEHDTSWKSAFLRYYDLPSTTIVK